jgi:hypothetical protein
VALATGDEAPQGAWFVGADDLAQGVVIEVLDQRLIRRERAIGVALEEVFRIRVP